MTRKLLVADDSVTIQKVVGLAFADEDVVIEAVSRGDEALERAKQIKPDIILADIFMPGLNGYAVCESIKSDPELRHIPVVLMVGSFEPFDSDEAGRVKSDACLTKPFDTNELVQTVRSLTPEASDQTAPAPDTRLREQTAVGITTATPWPLATEKSRESFLGTNAILDVLGPLNLRRSSRKEGISNELLRSIVEDVIKRLSPDIVREVAWEVVPELSEMLIRKKINEGGAEPSR
jgi:CheY-like chemotaxis protein